MRGDHLARGAMIMNEAELKRLEAELLHDQPRPVPRNGKHATEWTDEEMRAAERRIAAGLPLLPPGPGKAG